MLKFNWKKVGLYSLVAALLSIHVAMRFMSASEDHVAAAAMPLPDEVLAVQSPEVISVLTPEQVNAEFHADIAESDPLIAVDEVVIAEKAEPAVNYILCGGCKVGFSAEPQVIRETMDLAKSRGQLSYEVYRSKMVNGSESLLLVASYPEPVAPGQELKGIEGFIKGVVGNDNQLVFAHLTSVEGKEAVDFLIESPTSYFRGLVLMVGSKLYLIAMEGRLGSLDESAFERFSGSFSLVYSE